MTKRELIEELFGLPDDAVIQVETPDGYCDICCRHQLDSGQWVLLLDD
jgi:hypothetical protein